MLPEKKEFRFQDKTFTFSVCSTALELMKGLAGVTSIEDEEIDGMLFDFGVDHAAIMTPRGLNFPVEVAFIDRMGFVKEIKTLNPRLGYNIFASKPVRYVLEAPVGFFQTNNIDVDSRIDI